MIPAVPHKLPVASETIQQSRQSANRKNVIISTLIIHYGLGIFQRNLSRKNVNFGIKKRLVTFSLNLLYENTALLLYPAIPPHDYL